MGAHGNEGARTLDTFAYCRRKKFTEKFIESEWIVRENGVVKWFNGAKGYGFIQRQTGEDVFVHFSAIQENGYRTLNEGEAVEFECQQGPKGLNAENVIRNA
jgi:CspA family cold shock protein